MTGSSLQQWIVPQKADPRNVICARISIVIAFWEWIFILFSPGILRSFELMGGLYCAILASFFMLIGLRGMAGSKNRDDRFGSRLLFWTNLGILIIAFLAPYLIHVP